MLNKVPEERGSRRAAECRMLEGRGILEGCGVGCWREGVPEGKGIPEGCGTRCRREGGPGGLWSARCWRERGLE